MTIFINIISVYLEVLYTITSSLLSVEFNLLEASFISTSAFYKVLKYNFLTIRSLRI